MLTLNRSSKAMLSPTCTVAKYSEVPKSAMESFSNWVEASQTLLNSKKTLEDMLGNVKEIDNSLENVCKEQ